MINDKILIRHIPIDIDGLESIKLSGYFSLRREAEIPADIFDLSKHGKTDIISQVEYELKQEMIKEVYNDIHILLRDLRKALIDKVDLATMNEGGVVSITSQINKLLNITGYPSVGKEATDPSAPIPQSWCKQTYAD